MYINDRYHKASAPNRKIKSFFIILNSPLASVKHNFTLYANTIHAAKNCQKCRIKENQL